VGNERTRDVLQSRNAYANGAWFTTPSWRVHGAIGVNDQTNSDPTRKLYDLFWAIHSMKEQKPDEVVALSAKHEVVFLPPPPV